MNPFRSAIVRLRPYAPGFQPSEPGFIKLNTNENPYPPSPKVLDVIEDAAKSRLKLYPDPLSNKLRNRIAAMFGVRPDWVVAGNGSDEILDMIFRAVLGKNDRILITDPTYILYEVLAGFQEASVVTCELEGDFRLPRRIRANNAKLVVLANPNTPTGMSFERSEIEAFCRNNRAIVVIDEAYADFSDENCMDLVRKYRNVMVTRSLSKSYSLAGLRAGFAVGRPETIREILKVKDSYNLSALSQAGALAALEDHEWMRRNVARVIRDRGFTTRKLSAIGFDVLPSHANFIFAKHRTRDAKRLYELLYRRKILVRHFNRPRLKSYLRISIGTHQDMVRLVKALEEILDK